MLANKARIKDVSHTASTRRITLILVILLMALWTANSLGRHYRMSTFLIGFFLQNCNELGERGEVLFGFATVP